MKTEFEKKLKEHSSSYQCNTDDFYIICQNNDADRIINAQLIYSEPIEEVIHGSRNNNDIQAIGFFKFRLPTEVKEQDFLILAFQNMSKYCFEFIIIPQEKLMKRLNKENRISTDNRELEIVFWLMSDRSIYETTHISPEGEWYYLSKGIDGRKADKTDMEYTKFLNSWYRLMPS